VEDTASWHNHALYLVILSWTDNEDALKAWEPQVPHSDLFATHPFTCPAIFRLAGRIELEYPPPEGRRVIQTEQANNQIGRHKAIFKAFIPFQALQTLENDRNTPTYTERY